MGFKIDNNGHSSATCDQCGKYIHNSKDAIKGNGGIFSKDAFCCKAHKNQYYSSSTTLLDNSNNEKSYAGANQSVDIEAIAAARAEKARIDLEKEKHDDEMALKRRQQELEEKKNRQKRADDLRAQGKGTQAFFVEHGTAVGIGVLVLFIVLFFGYQELSSKSNTKEAAEINLKLEGIEDQIKLAIQDGNKEKALELANQLVHPLHEKWESKDKFDALNGYPFYDEYWTKKREMYREEILKKNVTTQSTESTQEQMQNQEAQSENQELSKTEETPIQQTTQKYYNGCGYSYESKEDCMTQCSAFNGGNCQEGTATGQIIKASKPKSENQ